MEAIVTEELLPYRDGRTMLESTYVAQTPWLFARGLERELPKPKRCTFRIGPDGGEDRELPLTWRWHRASALQDRIDAAARRSSGRVEHTEIAPGEYWIRLPTFNPGEEDLEAMQEIVTSVADLRGARQIVFDNRSRGHNEPYVPTLRYDGDVSDTEAVRRWVRTLPAQAAR